MSIKTFDVPEIKERIQTYDTTYRRSVRWDSGLGDFVRDGTNRLVACDGKEAYRTWCLKTAMTERYCCLAYPDAIGVEMEDALNEPDEKAVQSAIERTITEALMANPRTEYVRDFVFELEADTLHMWCTVKGIDTDSFEIELEI